MKIDIKVKFTKQEVICLDKELSKLKSAKLYSNEYASINLPIDKNFRIECSKLANKHKKAEVLVVVGIGGSNLGTMAIQEAVQGKLHNETKLPRVYYADTVDSNSILDILDVLENDLKNKKHVVINAISKSGGTTETIANFQILANLVKKHIKNFNEHIVITTTKNSKFDKVAKKEKFDTLYIPPNVGGRYSVLSPVGLFPLAVMGLDITGLLKGAKEVRADCLKSVKSNPAAKSALAIFHANQKGINIIDHFFFSSNLESLGKWYRQLMGESVGKEHDNKGKVIHQGLTPTVSIGSTDLHSMAQLYLGGPFDKFSFIVSANPKHTLKIPYSKRYNDLVSHIQGKPLTKIMDAIATGTMAAYKKAKRPFVHIHLNDHSAYEIGKFLQFKMFEMIFLAKLLNVNPFNQPAVEKYKVETKKELGK